MELYEILGVKRESNKEEISRAYKQKAKLHHPDRYTEVKEKEENEKKFKEINRAYNILNDEKKREQYDRYGMEGLKNPMMNGEEMFGEMNMMDPFDIFKQ